MNWFRHAPKEIEPDPNLVEENWLTNAIDSRLKWRWKSKETDEDATWYDHVLQYQYNKVTGKRRFKIADPDKNGAVFAEASAKVARMKILWEEHGIIRAYANTSNVMWLPGPYAPYGDLQQYIFALTHDPLVTDLSKEHQLLADAIGQLEVAAKLCGVDTRQDK